MKTNTPLKTPPADYYPAGSARWYTIEEGYDAGKVLFYYDIQPEDRAPEATLLLVHGNPETSYTYRHIRDRLIRSSAPLRIIAMDHIGFGLSDQASYEMVDMHHAHNLKQLISHLDLDNILLAVHDWGGPIGIGAAMQEPDRIAGLVVMNTTIFPIQNDGYTFWNYPSRIMPWSQLPKVVPDSLWGGVAAKAVSHGSPQGIANLSLSSLRYLLQYGMGAIPEGTPEYVWSQSLSTRCNARSSKRNVRQTPRWGHGYRYRDPTHGIQDNTAFYQQMQRQVPEVWGPAGREIPVAGFFGEWCPCGKPSVIAQWQEALPQTTVQTFPGVGHFVEEYKHKEIADGMLEVLGQLRT